MHIPDGFLAAPVWAGAWLISLAGLGYSLKKTAQALKEKMVPLMGVMSAFIFAGQMLNFPVIGGTSGHLLGAGLAAVLLGPYAASVVLTCVLIVQCLIFQDGGLTALGANIFNMALVAPLAAYSVYRLICGLAPQKKNILLTGSFLAAWFSVVAASAACALELAISRVSPLKTVLPAMAGIHALIGIGEAVITLLVLSFVLQVRPDLVYKFKNTGG